MPKFRYIITNTFDGKLEGTDDETTAKITADNEDSFVYDTKTGLWLDANGVQHELTEAPKLTEEHGVVLEDEKADEDEDWTEPDEDEEDDEDDEDDAA